jgi:hypothetical protein
VLCPLKPPHKAFNRTFGIIKDQTFQVEAKFTGWAAVYLSERVWSPDHQIEWEEDKLVIRFTAASESGVMSWMLSFGPEGRLVKREKMVTQLQGIIKSIMSKWI